MQNIFDRFYLHSWRVYCNALMFAMKSEDFFQMNIRSDIKKKLENVGKVQSNGLLTLNSITGVLQPRIEFDSAQFSMVRIVHYFLFIFVYLKVIH